MKLNLTNPSDGEKEQKERVKKAKAKKKKAVYIPTWEEVWIKGYGKKKGIFDTKISELDRKRLEEVKTAVEIGEIGTGVENLKKFSKSHALSLYKQLIEIRKEKIIAKMIAEKPSNYHLITNITDFSNMCKLLSEETIIGLDTETTGLEHTDHIVGLSMTLPKADYHCYIPVRHITGEVQLNPDFVFLKLKQYLENINIGKVLHNAKFDFHMFYKEGIYVNGLVMDTLIAMKVLNENEQSYALKNLATKYGKYFGFEDKSMTYEELFGKGGFEATPFDIATVYACKDTHLTYKLYLWITEQFKRLPKLGKIYYKLENPSIYVSFNMETNGMKMDFSFAKRYEKKLTAELEEMDVKMRQVFGDINLNSPKQLATFLYDEKGLPDITKKRSVDADTINKLAEKSEEVKILLDYRNKTKLLGTYIKPLPTKVWEEDKRLHGTFSSMGTHTGRYSSSLPNMQNLPPDARPMFVAPEGKVIIGKDLS